MITVKTVSEARRELQSARRSGASIGFVPTMGFLHDGHLALVDAARSAGASFLAVSIFVNPTQFGPKEDFNRYPRDEEGDSAKLASRGVDLLFMPPLNEMFANDRHVSVTVSGVASPLEGERRPGHFDGVATVVAKLFNIIGPDLAVFGQKDAQQCAVIRQMVSELEIPVKLLVVPTSREADGLAMSSRNVYLTAEQRAAAPMFHAALQAGRAALMNGESADVIEQVMRETLSKAIGIEIDYISLVDGATFEAPASLERDLVLVGAIRLGTTRLIDNIPVMRHEMPCRSTRRPAPSTPPPNKIAGESS
ncbi:MAG TPA: pantoate--beta-alanine ligase [Thermoanaerobaculia bacterium]|nr:pantoate--beta-alanine ligase [Thermoanaerobaculia bacterium]